MDREARVQRAVDEVRAGRIIILVDDEDRENEGDLCMAAECVTPEAINFMARYGRGLICLTLSEERVQRLGLSMMVQENRAPMGTAFTVSVEARRGVSTGISAADRACTIRTAVAKDARPEDLISPGHIFPLKARNGGVLVRIGQTEGSVDLARLAGLEPAGVICEVMRDDGEMARRPDLERFAEQHGLMILTIADLVEYRVKRERLVRRSAEGTMAVTVPRAGRPSLTLDLNAAVYTSEVDHTEYLALSMGDLHVDDPALVRVQSICTVGDVFGSASCDCQAQMSGALERIAEAGRGVLLYVVPRGNVSLAADFAAHVQSAGPAQGPKDAAPRAGAGGGGRPAALRDFGLGAQVLYDLGLRRIRLLTNNPKKIVALEGFGIDVVERVPIEIQATVKNIAILREKRDREGHLLSSVSASGAAVGGSTSGSGSGPRTE
jgi:3,4-dihydroxy 2-butanone 4-phosphate synthase/GTP cyclohydrolase II